MFKPLLVKFHFQFMTLDKLKARFHPRKQIDYRWGQAAIYSPLASSCGLMYDVNAVFDTKGWHTQKVEMREVLSKYSILKKMIGKEMMEEISQLLGKELPLDLFQWRGSFSSRP